MDRVGPYVQGVRLIVWREDSDRARMCNWVVQLLVNAVVLSSLVAIGVFVLSMTGGIVL